MTSKTALIFDWKKVIEDFAYRLAIIIQTGLSCYDPDCSGKLDLSKRIEVPMDGMLHDPKWGFCCKRCRLMHLPRKGAAHEDPEILWKGKEWCYLVNGKILKESELPQKK